AGAVGAVFGHVGVLYHDVVAARALQSADVPVVDDLVVAARDQEGTVIGCAAGCFGRHHGAEEGPLTVFGTGGKAPVAAQTVTAVDPGDLAHRHVGGGNQHAAVLAPDVLLGTVVKQRQL